MRRNWPELKLPGHLCNVYTAKGTTLVPLTQGNFMTTLLVTTGPESSGKTTLATQLAGALDAPLVPEIARTYLNEKRRDNPSFEYQQHDLLEIAKQQLAAEKKALRKAGEWLVCDTDLLVLMIWSDVKYGKCEPALQALFEQSLESDRRYLLCTPDMPWEPDPLRENPGDRELLFDRYLTVLEFLPVKFLTLSGSAERRFGQVLAHEY